MKHKYSSEISVRLLVALMKAHGVKKVVASPGSTNVCLSHSLQNDPFFEMYSSVDERSAAYLACGLSVESGEPVALTCTEATASRNYLSGLTEAFYRHIPILCITATNDITLVGQHHPQMIDRSVVPVDAVRKSVFLPYLANGSDTRGWVNILNDTMLELFRAGGGPVHIEYETRYETDYSVENLPAVNITHRLTANDSLPEIPHGKIAVYVGAHKRWDNLLTEAVDAFCAKYGAVVLCDSISNYHGKYGVYYTLLTSQTEQCYACASMDLCIYIGDISSAYGKSFKIGTVWRVNPDGKLRDMLRRYGGRQQYVFEMEELTFFDYYAQLDIPPVKSSYLAEWRNCLNQLSEKIPDLPFSNLWVAQHTTDLLPAESRLFLGIENTLRCWNFFAKNNYIDGYCNTGGFGIDGGVSSLIGASFADRTKLYFGVTGDLAFFYDMNVLGNRHVGKNLRLIVINNAIGQQFKNPQRPEILWGGLEDEFVAAAGHFGNKSATLLRHYAEDLGFEYMSARNKEEFAQHIERFCCDEITDKPMLFEIFTDTAEETLALRIISSLETDTLLRMQHSTKAAVKSILGDKAVKSLKRIMK